MVLAESIVVLQKSDMRSSVHLPDVAGCSGVSDALIRNPVKV